MAAWSFLPGCGYTANPNYHLPSGIPLGVLDGPLVAASLAVGTAPSGSIPARFLGLSYEKTAISYNYFHPSNHNLIALFRLLGAGVLRIGGGSVDRVLWTSAKTGTHLEVTASNIKQLAAFLKAAGWQCIYGVNFAASTPQLAGEEVGSAFLALGENLLGIEIGNEPDDYGVTGNFFAGDWTYQDFLVRWQLFRSAIQRAAPGVPITGPAGGGGNHIATWTIPFGEAVGSEIILLTQHYYRQTGASPLSTAAFLVSPDTQLTSDLTALSAGAAQLGLPYRMSECNSFSNGGAIGVSDSYASSLWVIDFCFAVASFGSTGINLHGGGNAPGYTPIADDSGAVIEARPEYYGLLLFSLAGEGELLQTILSAGSVDATAYAVQTAAGGLNIVVVNKDTQQNLVLTIEAGRSITTATIITMNGASLAATSGVTIQGATVNSDGRFNPKSANGLTPSGTQVMCAVAALTAALICIT
jgi:hypothetical protein